MSATIGKIADPTTVGPRMADEREREAVRIEPSPKRVRVYLGGEVVADSLAARLVWEIPFYPAYYFPADDVRTELLTPTGHTTHDARRGEATLFTVKSGEREAVDGAWQYVDSPVDELRDLVRFDWEAMGAWFEEDEEVIVHPRSPYSRVDILHSSRHVEVSVNGEKVADSTNPTLLFETGLPTRYYLPQPDVRMDLLHRSDTKTRCPYKGEATHWSIDAGGERLTDRAWSYPFPLPESQKIAGKLAFYNEKVDLTVDGVALERARTHFS